MSAVSASSWVPALGFPRNTPFGASSGALGQLGRVLCVCVFVCLSLVLSFVQLFLPVRSVPGRERRLCRRCRVVELRRCLLG